MFVNIIDSESIVFTLNGPSGFSSLSSPRSNQNSDVFEQSISVIISALFFLSFLLIFSAINLKFKTYRVEKNYDWFRRLKS